MKGVRPRHFASRIEMPLTFSNDTNALLKSFKITFTLRFRARRDQRRQIGNVKMTPRHDLRYGADKGCDEGRRRLDMAVR